LVVCGVECQCAPRPGDLSRSGRTCTVAAHAKYCMECGVCRVWALGGTLGVVCDARLSRCGHPSYAWSGRDSAHTRCIRLLVCLAVYGIGLIAGGDQYLVPGHGSHPFPVDRTSQFVSPDLYSLFFQPLVVGSLFVVTQTSFVLLPEDTDVRIDIGFWSIALFCACMVCHGELSRAKPAPRFLTAYYLVMALAGGVRWHVCRGDSATRL
jgi:hypothetical protein